MNLSFQAKDTRSLSRSSLTNPEVVDFLVIGAGIVGMSVALQLKEEYPDTRVALVDKENEVSLHASGRNSGVIHAGFYYSPDSLKAKLTVAGNLAMRDYCLKNQLPLIQCGKVVVAQSGEQAVELERLYRQGTENGVTLELVDEKDLAKIEPLARTRGLALWSPNTAVADPRAVSLQLKRDIEQKGIDIWLGDGILRRDDPALVMNSGMRVRFSHVVNAAGLYADRIAHMFGHGDRYKMLPFLGLYLIAPRLQGTLTSHIYPVPDSRNPFLGAHLTRTAANHVKLGPSAIPVVSREQYQGIGDLKIRDFLEILGTFPRFFFSKHHDALSLVRTELPKISRAYLRNQVAPMVRGIDLGEFNTKGKPGIRAQLFDLASNKLEMDFAIEGDSSSTHILNAVSPGWTTCFSFSKHVVDDIALRLN